MNTHVIGLDFGRHTLKVVRLERRWRGTLLTHAETLVLPPGDADRTMIAQRWLESLPWVDGACVAAIPGRLVIVKEFDLEPDDPRSVRQAASVEAQRLTQMAGAEFLHDVMELSPSHDVRRSLLFMARESDITSIVGPVNQTEMELLDVIPSSVALFRAMRLAQPLETGMAVGIDIGLRSTDVVVGVGDRLQLVRTFDLGVESFVEAFAQDSKISSAKAEELLNEQKLIGGGDRPHGAGAVDSGGATVARPGYESMDGVVRAWIAELDHTLAWYRDRFPDTASNPDRIWLAGGGASLLGLHELIGQLVHAPVSLLICGVKHGSVERPERYAVAIGLAQEGLADHSLISLAPPNATLNRRWRRERWRWFAILLLVVSSMALVWLRDTRASQFKQEMIERQKRMAETAAALRDDLSAERNANARIFNRLKRVGDVTGNRRMILRMIGALSDTKSETDWITSFEALTAPTSGVARLAGGMPATTNETSRFVDFVIRGYTPDGSFQSVRAMIHRLQQDSRVKSVDLDSAVLQGEPWNNKPDDLVVSPFALRMIPADPATEQYSENAISESMLRTDNEADLRFMLQGEHERGRALGNGWSHVRQAMATFRNRRDVFNLPAEENVALIDFRVALLETRSRLLNQARQRGVILPADFGLADVARDDKSVRQSLYELATLRVLAGVALDGGVSGIENIETLPPVTHADDREVFMEEYPLKIRVKCRFSVFVGLLDELGSQSHGMIIKALRVERRMVEEPDMVEAEIVVASLVFPDAPVLSAQARKGGNHDV